MTYKESIKWLENLKEAIGESQYQGLWHYEQALDEIIELLHSDRFVELPCKVGETLYCISYNDNLQLFVEEYKNISLINILTLMTALKNLASRIIFLTGNKEEAEAKLKELKK